MIGKGLSASIIFKFFSYTSATLIPSALPLAILLSSIMSIGKFGENSELTAAKASGISLFRFFKSTIVFTILVSIFAFYYSNFIYTKTKAVAQSMLTDVRNLKPSLLIKPNQFYNGLSGVTLRVDSKNDKTGELYGIKVYNHSRGSGNESILLAKRGNLSQSEDGKILIFKLDSGIQYKDEASSSFDNIKYPFYITQFSSFEKRFDLTQFQLGDISKNPDAERLTMNIGALNHTIDSMGEDLKLGIYKYDTSFLNTHPAIGSKISPKSSQIQMKDSILRLNQEEKIKFKMIRTNKIRNVKNSLFVRNSEAKYTKSIRNLMKVEWHRKFTLAISCLVLFFVGAPLGAIIKKGGIGLPMVISVILFILFYFTTMIGTRFAENEILSPFFGMWVSTFIFLPFGIYLTIKAMNDSQVMNIEGYSANISNFFAKYVKRK